MMYEFRCDSPACRRLLQLEIRKVDNAGAVEFHSTTLEEDVRELPHLRVLEYPDVRTLTHGICEDCLEKMTGELAAIG